MSLLIYFTACIAVSVWNVQLVAAMFVMARMTTLNTMVLSGVTLV